MFILNRRHHPWKRNLTDESTIEDSKLPQPYYIQFKSAYLLNSYFFRNTVINTLDLGGNVYSNNATSHFWDWIWHTLQTIWLYCLIVIYFYSIYPWLLNLFHKGSTDQHKYFRCKNLYWMRHPFIFSNIILSHLFLTRWLYTTRLKYSQLYRLESS